MNKLCSCEKCPRCLHREQMRRWRAKHPEADRENGRRSYARNAEQRRAKILTYQKENPEKMRAQYAARHEIKMGRLIVQACQDCGLTPEKLNGRQRIQAHHEDYSRPLDVTWLCVSCHHLCHVQ